jgi:hypothetical protein
MTDATTTAPDLAVRTLRAALPDLARDLAASLAAILAEYPRVPGATLAGVRPAVSTSLPGHPGLVLRLAIEPAKETT